jgi:replication factor C subunit 3/5
MSAPTKEEALDVVNNIATKEGVTVNEHLIYNLFRKCQNNLTRTINTINLIAIKSPHLLNDATVSFPNIDPVASKLHEIIQLFNAQTFHSIVQIRSILYILLAHGVSPENIIKRLFRILIHNLKGYESQIIELTSGVEAMLNKSSREFYHLENYIIGLMALVKNYKPIPVKEKVTLKLTDSTKKENIVSTKPKITKPKITIKQPAKKKIQLKKKSDKDTLNLSKK